MNIFDSTFISVANRTSIYLADVTGTTTDTGTDATTSKVPSAITDVTNYLNGKTAAGTELDSLKKKGFGIGAQIAMIVIGLVFLSVVVFMVINAGKYGGSNANKVQEGKEGLGRGTVALLIITGIIGAALFIAGIASALF